MSQPFELKAATCTSLKNKAKMGVFDGTSKTIKYLNYCSVTHTFSSTNLAYTRDIGYHSGGMFKNPDYERCYHLSLSFFDPETKEPDSKNSDLTDEWLSLFFGNHKNLLWAEPPKSDRGKKLDVWHYRLFVHSDWNTPLLPKGEVYSKRDTPVDWKSWSELQAEKKEDFDKLSEAMKNLTEKDLERWAEGFLRRESDRHE